MWIFAGYAAGRLLQLMFYPTRIMYLICSFFKYIFLFCSYFEEPQSEQSKNGLSAGAGGPSALAIIGGSVVAVDAFVPFVLFLGMQAERGNWPRLQPAQVDRLVRLDTVTIGTVLDPAKCRLDLL